MTFVIEGLIDKPRWYDIPCKCNHDSVETEFPIFKCLHCQFQSQEDSMPRESFQISKTTDEGSEIVTCNKIKINRGDKYQEIIGWFNLV